MNTIPGSTQGNDTSPCPVCGRYKNRVLTVDAVVIDGDRVLLIQRKNEPYKGYWALPGGYMDFDETAKAAACRELGEETGLRSRNAEFFGLYDDPGRHPEQVVSAVFRITAWEGDVRASDDALEAKWFPLAGLPSNLAFDHRIILKAAAT